jgi:hypothetical protein
VVKLCSEKEAISMRDEFLHGAQSSLSLMEMKITSDVPRASVHLLFMKPQTDLRGMKPRHSFNSEIRSLPLP